MPDEHEIRNLCEASLEDVLNRLYLAPFYRWLYETKMRELAQAHLDRLPQPEPPQSRNKKQPPRKDELANLLLAILRQPGLSRQFLAAFPPGTQKALRILSWERVVNLQALETAVGGEIARLNPDERYRYYEPFQVVEEHGFVCVLRKPEMARWSYYHVLGRRQTYEIAKTAAPHATVLLDESRLLVTCENADALTELTLTGPAQGLVLRGVSGWRWAGDQHRRSWH